jgi:hypothetical protein
VKRVVLATAALVAAVAVWIALSLPPARIVVPSAGTDAASTVPGVFHVHTNRSDGRSSPEDVAAAAARAGLKFVIFTDHGDGTAKPASPAYHDGVLCIDAVEVSTRGGHYIAVDMPASPYPLAGDPRDVIEDVRRLGGFGIVAHPDSPKDDLRWREWNEPFDGIELVNLDTGWRTRVAEAGWRSMITALATYPFRPTETIGHLAGESTVAFARWESLTRRRRIVALGGADAHAKISLADVDPGDNRFSLPIPGYQAALGSVTLHVRLERELSGDAASDAKLVVAAIRSGQLYTALNAIAAPPYLEFTATNGRGSAEAGGELPADGPVTLRVRTNAPPGFKATVWRGLEQLSADRSEQDFTVAAPADPAVYRVEVRATDRSRSPLWLLSNPIYVRGSAPTTVPPARPPATDSRRLFDERDATGWSTETDQTSLAAFDVRRGTTAPEIGFRFGLATGDTTHQFAAIGVVTPDGLQQYDRLTFEARAETAMRISVQVRAPVNPDYQERWERSVYLDSTDRQVSIFFDDMTPVGATQTFRPMVSAVRSIVFAVDRTNTAAGTSGRIWLKNVRLER